MEKLADIKDFTTVNDYSFYIFLGIVGAIVLILIVAILKLVHFLKHRQKSQAQIAKEILLSIDFSNSKQASYQISKYGIFLAKNDLCIEFLGSLNEKLAKYKYQKNVPDFSEEDRMEFKKFMELCDV